MSNIVYAFGIFVLIEMIKGPEFLAHLSDYRLINFWLFIVLAIFFDLIHLGSERRK